MEGVRMVTKDGTLYALFFRGTLRVEGVKFLTPPELPMQLGLMEHPAGHRVEPHQHPAQPYDVRTMSEFLFIERGKIKATVYDEEWNVLGEETLGPSDFLLFLRGGHSIEVLEAGRFLEVKQGPFPGDAKAKTYLTHA